MKYLEYAGLAVAGLLFFIWPIPHTISIRYGAIFLALFLFAYLVYRKRPLVPAGFRIPFLLFALLTAWLLFSAVFISSDTARTLDEIRGQWLMGFAALLVAVLLALSTRHSDVINRRRILMLLFGVLFAHILYLDIASIYKYLTTGVLPHRFTGYASVLAGFTEGIDKSSYLSNYLLMILGADLFFRSLRKRSFLPLNTVVVIFALLCTIFSIYLENARNGTGAAFVSSLAMLVMYLLVTRIGVRRTILAAIFLIVISGFLYKSIKSDPRWQTLLETIPVALDTQNNRAWINLDKYDLPKLKSGEVVQQSNYERVAWFKEGVILVWENPLGVGFDRSAYGRALKIKYKEKATSHSHSGIVDFAVGTGIPGLVLWLAFILYLLGISLRTFVRHKNYFALLLFFTVFNFSLRMVVDSTIRDHMLQQFMFLTGVFFTLMLLEDGAYESERAAQTNRIE